MSRMPSSPAVHRSSGRGYYADPASPIASTPQRPKRHHGHAGAHASGSSAARSRTKPVPLSTGAGAGAGAASLPSPSQLSPMRPPRASRRRTSTDKSPSDAKSAVVGPAGSGAGHMSLAARGRDMHAAAYGVDSRDAHARGFAAPTGRAGAGAGVTAAAAAAPAHMAPAVSPVEADGDGEGEGEGEGGTWQDALFSPVLKFFGADGEAVAESKVKEVADVSTPTTPTGTSSGSSDGSTRTTVSERRMDGGGGTPSYGGAGHAATPPHGRASGAAGGVDEDRDVAPCSLASPSLYTRKRDYDDRGSDREEVEDGYGAAAAPGAGVDASDSPMGGSEDDPGIVGGAVVRYEAGSAATDASGGSHGTGASGAAEGEGEGEEEDEFEEFNPYLFIKYLPAYRDVCPVGRPLCLPKKTRHAPRLSLVLDLDETLVHCSVEAIPDADLTFPVEFNGVKYQVYVRKRPYLDHFLEAVADKYEVTVFTASQKVYAERLLNLIDPHRRLVKFRLFRDSCLNVDGNYLKDLTVLGRDLRSTVLVDNSPHAFGYQVDNGIPIESWFEDKSDTELLKLMGFLSTLENVPDVRTAVRDKFQVHRLVAAAT